MSRFEGIRTVVTVAMGLAFLLGLAYICGTLGLPAELVANLGYSGAAMVLGQAGKGSMEVWAKRPPALPAGATSTTVSVQAVP